jgi:hypothetical protein
MKITVRPSAEPRREIDITNRLVAAIAEELWRLFGGNDRLNWLEAETHLQRIIGLVKEEAQMLDCVASEGMTLGIRSEPVGRWSPPGEVSHVEQGDPRPRPAPAPRRVRLPVGRSKCVRARRNGVGLGHV